MFTLITLPYAHGDLAPVISAETIDLHHGKHLATYVANLNKLIEGTDLAVQELDRIVANSTGAIFNNAGQLLNHNLYFEQLRPARASNLPVGTIAQAIAAQYGSFEQFRQQFGAAAISLFGSGWAWLASDSEGTLSIIQEPNAGNPVTRQLTPIMCFDVWEHAYYVDYRNRRADHVDAMWSIINWDVVEERYKKAISQ